MKQQGQSTKACRQHAIILMAVVTVMGVAGVIMAMVVTIRAVVVMFTETVTHWFLWV